MLLLLLLPLLFELFPPALGDILPCLVFRRNASIVPYTVFVRVFFGAEHLLMIQFAFLRFLGSFFSRLLFTFYLGSLFLDISFVLLQLRCS